ncbi:MAG TPA: lamin tail domain-containing protein, partial [Verrucomicrobiae bacterium]
MQSDGGITLCFNEALDQASVTNLLNYTFADGAIATTAVLLADGKTVKLAVSGVTNSSFNLSVHGVRDLPGNTIGSGVSFHGKLTPDTRHNHNLHRADSVVVFNEIMYNPSAMSEALEWIELHNQMTVDVDLSAWSFSGIDYTFPDGTIIAGGGYLVVAADPAALQAATGFTGALGPFQGNLANKGESLALFSNTGRLMDEMEYNDKEPWPVGADGSGASLAKVNPMTASGPASNWRASAQIRGTPGAENFPEPGTVVPRVDVLLANAAAARVLIPTNGALGSTWTQIGFNDSSWTLGTNGVGFQTNSSVLAGPTTNLARGKPVIDGSGAFGNFPYNVPDPIGNFTALNVTDGSTSDSFGANYWLGRDGVANEYFTLDLQQVWPVQRILLRNTHNDFWNDRGTASFQVWAATSIDANKQLISPQLILAGTLSLVNGQDPIQADVFSSANGLTPVTARFLRFVALTANNPGNNVGLNEIEVYAAAENALPPPRYYPFEGNANDVSPNGINGVVSGAQFVPQFPPALATGQSLNFDGVNNVVQINDPANPNAYTLSAWVRLDTVRSCTIVVKVSACGQNCEWSHQLRVNAAGQFESYCWDGGYNLVTGTTVAQPGQWYHICGTVTGGGVLRLYVNGVQEGPDEPIGNLWTGADRWLIGSNSGHTPYYFDGLIDDVAIWPVALSPQQVAALAAGASPLTLGTGSSVGFFNTDIRAQMFQVNSTAFLRLPFSVSGSNPYDQLTLNLQYDDGFIAYLNGVEVARRNAPAGATWNSAATAEHPTAAVLSPETIDLTANLGLLLPGQNVLAIHGLNLSASDADFLVRAELTARQAILVSNAVQVVINEVAAATNHPFWLELLNCGLTAVPLHGFQLGSSSGSNYVFGAELLGPGQFLVLDETQLGFTNVSGDKLFLLSPGGGLVDAARITGRLRGRAPDDPTGPLLHPNAPTPGATNTFTLHHEIVINEIMYHHRPDFTQTNVPGLGEEWIELYNRSTNSVDVGGWSLDDAVKFTFPTGTIVAASNYLVVAGDAAVLRVKYPAITIMGDFSGKLPND